MAPLMAPKPITPWARALLHYWEQFKVVECWQWGGVYRCWFWVGCLSQNPLPYCSMESPNLHPTNSNSNPPTLMWMPHMFDNVRLKMEFGEPKVKDFWPRDVRTLKELGFKVGPSFIGKKCSPSTLMQDNGL